MSRASTTILCVAAALAIAAPAAGAQSVEIPQVRPDSATVRANKRLFTKRDLAVAGAFTATTLLFFPLDQRIADELQEPSVQASHFFRNAAKGVEVIATPGAYFIGGGMYLVGRVAGKPRIADLGWHGVEGVILGEVTATILKGTLGRARPFVSPDDPRNFGLGRGFRNGQWKSFPSGHTTTAFAAAAAVTDETTLWWPRSTWIVGPVMYGGATLVGLSRMYTNRHWASDIALGALIGTFSGKKVVLASHSNPRNIIDRAMLGGFIRPSELGTLDVGWKKAW